MLVMLMSEGQTCSVTVSEEGGRELVHCTLSQLTKMFLYYIYMCAIWYRVS